MSAHEYQIPEKALGKVYFYTYRSFDNQFSATYNDNNFVDVMTEEWSNTLESGRQVVSYPGGECLCFTWGRK